MLLATIQDATGRKRHITKCKGASAPATIDFSPRMCGYWESRLELFMWACEVARVDPYTAQWVDGFTGETLDYYDLEDEYHEVEEAERS